MTIARLRVALSGPGIVGPGLMTFYSRNLTPPLAASVLQFCNDLAAYWCGSLTATVPNGGDTIDEATGTLMGGWSGSGGGTSANTNNQTYALGTGGLFRWETGAVYGGHKVQGHTFLVPIPGNRFDGNGNLNSGQVAAMQAAANNLITANNGDLVIWSRPRKAGSGKHGNLPARAGAAFPITSCQIPITPTALRSRRT